MNTSELMKLTEHFSLNSTHPWRAEHYTFDATIGQPNERGLIMIEMLFGEYQVCRIEPFLTPEHRSVFDDELILESIDYQPKYYGSFKHNELDKAFTLALELNKRPIETNTIEGLNQ